MAWSLQCRGTVVSGYWTAKEGLQAQTGFAWPLPARLGFMRPALSQQNPLSWSGLKTLGHHTDHGDNPGGQRGAGGLQYIDFYFFFPSM